MAAVAFHTYCQPETVSTTSWPNRTPVTDPIFFKVVCKKMWGDRLQTGKLVLSFFKQAVSGAGDVLFRNQSKGVPR